MVDTGLGAFSFSWHTRKPSSTLSRVNSIELGKQTPPQTPISKWRRVINQVSAINLHNTIIKPIMIPQNWSSDNNHIIGYRPSSLFTYGFIFSFKGSIFSLRTVGSIIVYLIIAILYGGGVCDSSTCVTNSPDSSCSNLYGHNKCLLSIDSQAGLLLNTVSAFICSIFVGLTLDRWRQTRDAISVLLGSTNNLFLSSSVHISDSITNENIVRLAIAAQCLIYAQAESADGISRAFKLGLITNDEKKILLNENISPTTKYLPVLQWVSLLVSDAYSRGKIPVGQFAVISIQTSVSEIRASAARIFALINTQLPFVYTQLVTIVCKFHMLLVSLWAGSILGTAYSSGSALLAVEGFLLCIINVVIFESLLEVHLRLYNPFGNQPHCFPCSDYLRSSHQAGKSLVRPLQKPPCLTIER